MVEKYKTTCPLNCWDACGLLVSVNQGEIVGIEGDKEHEVTRGFICSKGKAHMDRYFHPERLKQPLLKRNGKWEGISWDYAYHLIIENLNKAISHDTRSIFYYTDSAHNGVLKNVEKRFFNSLGDISVASGSLCWSAGMLAQDLDFGSSISHDYSDLLNAQTVIVWGRNPVETAIHQVPYIKKAQKNGAHIIVIDPRKTATAKLADTYVSIRPGTDGALALAMAHWIIHNGYIDEDFIKNHVRGFETFKQEIASCTPAWAALETGIPEADIIYLAESYARQKPAAVLIGYGLQRYSNGMENVRAIDALGAVTGQIGMAGGGVNYANKQVANYIDSNELEGNYLGRNHRCLPKGALGKAIQNASAPSLKMMFVTKANPVLQAPDTDKILQAMGHIDFKVVIDMFLTDTAGAADLVLPCTSVFEQEDIYFTSMGHNLVSYGPKILENYMQSKSELEIFTDIANRMNLEAFPDREAEAWLKLGIKPLENQLGITLNMLKEKEYRLPQSFYQSWKDKVFSTPSQKFELYSEFAKKMGLFPTATYIPPFKKGRTEEESTRSNQKNVQMDGEKDEGKYKHKEDGSETRTFYFITPHTASSLHSQHFVDKTVGELGDVFINPDAAKALNIEEGEKVLLASPVGELTARAIFDPHLRQDTVYMWEGQWIDRGGSVNTLIEEGISSGGGQAALYETKVSVKSCDKTGRQ